MIDGEMGISGKIEDYCRLSTTEMGV